MLEFYEFHREFRQLPQQDLALDLAEIHGYYPNRYGRARARPGQP